MSRAQFFFFFPLAPAARISVLLHTLTFGDLQLITSKRCRPLFCSLMCLMSPKLLFHTFFVFLLFFFSSSFFPEVYLAVYSVCSLVSVLWNAR